MPSDDRHLGSNRRLELLAAAWIACLAVPAIAAAQSRDEPASAAAERVSTEHLIGQLSHDDYPVRQSAAAELLDRGHEARAALVENLDAPDPEVRAAARRLVTLIDQTAFDQRLDRFAADVDGSRGATLPGWEEFGRLVGTDEAARQLFVDMQRCEAPLLATAFGENPEAARGQWEARLSQLQQLRTNHRQANAAPPLGSSATMIFLSTSTEAGESLQGAMEVSNLVRRPPIRELLAQPDQADTVRRLVVAWVTDCPVSENAIVNARLRVLLGSKLTEALPMALAVARGEPPYFRVGTGNRVLALLAVARHGTDEHVEPLEPLLEDDAEFYRTATPGQQRSAQIRDVALATMLHLTDQRPEDYGFDRVQRNRQTVFTQQSLALPDDDARDAAIDQWRTWREAHPPKTAQP